MYVHQAFSRIHADRAMARMGVGLQIAGKGTVFKDVSLPVSGMTWYINLIRFLGGVSWLNLNGRDLGPRVGINKLSVAASVCILQDDSIGRMSSSSSLLLGIKARGLREIGVTRFMFEARSLSLSVYKSGRSK